MESSCVFASFELVPVAVLTPSIVTIGLTALEACLRNTIPSLTLAVVVDPLLVTVVPLFNIKV
jgi:hypothetical protein